MNPTSSTPWSLLQVEGDDDGSENEEGGPSEAAADSSGPSSILSPTSKRARKRAVAARNKRLAKEAKEAASAAAAAAATSGTTTMNGSSSAKHQKTVPPTFVSQPGPAKPVAAQSREKVQAGGTKAPGGLIPPTFVGSSAASQPAADKPFLASSAAQAADPASSPAVDSQASSKAVEKEASQVQFSDEEESEEEDPDASVLVDEDEELTASSAASQDEGEEEEESEDGDDSAMTPKQERSAAFEAAAATSGEDAPLTAKVAGDGKDSSSLSTQQTGPAQGENALQYGTDHDPSKKRASVVTRTVWTLIMIGGFIGLVLMGHVYLIILVLVCQALVFKEISALFDVAAKPLHHGNHHHHKSATRVAKDARARAERERWSKVLSWYFFAVTNYFLHGETIIYYFKHIVFVDAYFVPFARHHRFISFMLYILGFVGFVTNLKRNQLRRQFGLFCWIHMSLLLMVVSSHFIVNNILEGIIWFWIPASEVIMNDIAAYIWGMLYGRTQLIKLSPKKTVEGFVGAAFTTVLFGYLWATIFMRFPYMVCPATDLGSNAFSGVTCSPNDVFIWRSFPLSGEVSTVLSTLLQTSITSIPYAPFQFHAIVMAIFASLVAPFGGFFASGFKRAFNVKDFGDSIPGHGGMTDRMDCQFLMGLFAYVYYSSIIRDNHVTVGAVMQTVVASLSTQEQVELAKALTGYLAQQGVKW